METRLLEAEELLGEVRAAGVGGRVLCRLLLGVGTALPKCDRHDDAVAVLTDAVHLARARSDLMLSLFHSTFIFESLFQTTPPNSLGCLSNIVSVCICVFQ